MTKTKPILALMLGLTLTAVASGWYLSRRWYDPLYGLKEFPLDEYLRDYSPLAGADFQCRWTYVNELWSQAGVRMAVFKSEKTAWPITVAVPEELTNEAELVRDKAVSMKVTVAKEGLIYAKMYR